MKAKTVSKTVQKKDKPEKKEGFVRKDMMMSEAINMHPDIAMMLVLEYGMHCVGCGAAMFETLDDGFKAHGKTDEEIDKIIDEINKKIDKNSNSGK
jgi:hybrid cluster-associated redox disulfide protein